LLVIGGNPKIQGGSQLDIVHYFIFLVSHQAELEGMHSQAGSLGTRNFGVVWEMRPITLC